MTMFVIETQLREGSEVDAECTGVWSWSKRSICPGTQSLALAQMCTATLTGCFFLSKRDSTKPKFRPEQAADIALAVDLPP
jgi:hypothetical protein